MSSMGTRYSISTRHTKDFLDRWSGDNVVSVNAHELSNMSDKVVRIPEIKRKEETSAEGENNVKQFSRCEFYRRTRR